MPINSMKNARIYLILTAIVFSVFIFSCEKDPLPDEGKDLSGITYAPEPFEMNIPQHFPPMPNVPGNPLTVDGVNLGRHLFYDPILSRDSTISCESCHKQHLAFTDGMAKSIGIDGRVGTRSSMSLVNLAWAGNGLFWEGRSKSLEEQALHPIEDPLEMDEKLPNVVRKLQRHSTYPEMFRKAFGINNTKEISPALIGKALAQFQRTIVSWDSKFDKALYYQTEFFDGDELDAYLMMFVEEDPFFEDAECLHCHNPGAFFTDNSYRHNGLLSESESVNNPGRMLVTNALSDQGKFRVPTLRNIAVTGPYMHDGRILTLEEVLDHYFSGGHPHPNRDGLLRFQAQTNFSDVQKQAMVKMLHTLTDSTLLTNPKLSNPFN